MALLAFLLLPKDPGSAWFLNTAERGYAAQRIRIDNERYVLREYGATNTSGVSQRLTKRDIIETAKDWKLWSVLICNIYASVPSQAFSVFLPVVVQGMGYSSNQANLVSNFFLTSNLLSFFLVFMLTISPDVRSTVRVRCCGLVCCCL